MEEGSTREGVCVERVNRYENKCKTVRKSQGDLFVYAACMALGKCRGKKSERYLSPNVELAICIVVCCVVDC